MVGQWHAMSDNHTKMQRGWVLPLIAVACIAMLLIAVIGGFVAWKAGFFNRPPLPGEPIVGVEGSESDPVVAAIFDPNYPPDLSSLAGHKDIQKLTLWRPPVAESQFEVLRELPQLKWVVLRNAALTNRGALFVATAHQIEHITIDGAAITGNGLIAIATMPKIRRLSVARCPITDQDLAELAKYNTKLEELYIRDTGVTEAGVQLLKESWKYTKIFRY